MAAYMVECARALCSDAHSNQPTRPCFRYRNITAQNNNQIQTMLEYNTAQSVHFCLPDFLAIFGAIYPIWSCIPSCSPYAFYWNVAGNVAEKNRTKQLLQIIFRQYCVSYVFCAHAILGSLLCRRYCIYQTKFKAALLYLSKDYDTSAMKEYDMNGIVIYCPEEGQITGYDYFPSSSYDYMIQLTELRGKALKDGFRSLERE